MSLSPGDRRLGAAPPHSTSFHVRRTAPVVVSATPHGGLMANDGTHEQIPLRASSWQCTPLDCSGHKRILLTASVLLILGVLAFTSSVGSSAWAAVAQLRAFKRAAAIAKSSLALGDPFLPAHMLQSGLPAASSPMPFAFTPSQERAHGVLAQPSTLPIVRDRTSIHCNEDGAGLDRRSCMVQNACLDAHNRWVFYAGEDAPEPAPGAPLCVGPACNGEKFVWPLPVRFEEFLIRPVVMRGAPEKAPAALSPQPAGPSATASPAVFKHAVRWFDESQPVFVQSRHHPSNYFHAICDDFYGLYWALRRPFWHPAYSPDSPDGFGGSGAVAVDVEDVPTVINLIIDRWPFDMPSQKLSTRFHHVKYTDAAGLRKEDGGSELMCFRRVLMGSPGITVHRNAAYAYHELRRWPQPINAATQQADQVAFARFFTARVLVEGGVDLATYSPPLRDTIIVLDREGKRRMKNPEEVAAAVKASGRNFTVLPTMFEGMAPAKVALMMQRAVMVIAVHGAGLTNILHMQPGSLVLEIIPESRPDTALFFGALAHNLGLKHTSMVGTSVEFEDPVKVHVDTLRAHVDVLLSDIDGRTPT